MEHFQNDQIIYIILSTEIIMCKNSSEKKQNFISRIQVVMICLFSIRLRKCEKERKKMHAVYMTSRSQEHVYSRIYLTFTRNVEDKMNKRKRQRSFLNSIFFPPDFVKVTGICRVQLHFVCNSKQTRKIDRYSFCIVDLTILYVVYDKMDKSVQIVSKMFAVDNI